MVKIEKDNSISIGFGEGIGKSVLSDFSDMMGVNIVDNPGVASINLKFQKIKQTVTAKTFTATAAVDLITVSDTLWHRGSVIGTPVLLTTTGTLPAGLALNTVYYVINISTSTINYKLASTLKLALAGTAIDITDAGTGTHTITPITPKGITGWTQNSQGRIFALDTDQRVWFGGDNGIDSPWYLLVGNTTVGDGAGIVYYKGYILVWGNGGIDALLDIQSGTETLTWTNGFDGVMISNGGKATPYLSVNDDSIYFYNGVVAGRYYQVGLLEEVAGQTFDPTSGTTFSCVIDALTTPFQSGSITAINELGENLILGTQSYEVYVWDKKSPSFTSYVTLQEENVNSIRVVDNLAYIFMNYSGNVYQFNLTSSGLLVKVPEQITNQYYKFFTGLDEFKTNYSVLYKREILFSISVLNVTTTSNYLMSYNLDTKQLTKKNVSAYGETSERSAGTYGCIYSIFADGENILLSSSSYTIGGDVMSYAIESLAYKATIGDGSIAYYVYDGNEPYIITGLISYGQPLAKGTLKELQISLLRALATGQGISVSYRLDDTSAWSTAKDITYAVDGATKDIKVPYPITDIIDLQIKINLDGVNLTSPMLKLVRLIP